MDRPQISISSCFDYAVPLEKQVPLVADAGFSHISLGQDHNHSGILDGQRQRELKELLNRNNLRIDSIHGPHLSNPDNAGKLRDIISAAVCLEAPVIVVHPVPFELDEADFSKSLDTVLRTIEEIKPLLIETGIELAIENVMPGPATELAIQAIGQLDSDFLGFCYDSSHEQVDGPRGHDLLERMKDRVIAVHLSDRVKEFVDHVPPGEGFIDWSKLTALLKNTSFRGPLLFEVMVEHSSVKETVPFLKLVCERAVWIHSMVR